MRGTPTPSLAEASGTVASEEGFSLVGEVTWLASQGASPFDPNDGASVRSLKGISLTTTMSSSLLLFAGSGDPTEGSSSDEEEISDAGDADRDEMMGDEGAELLGLSPLFSSSVDLLNSLFLMAASTMWSSSESVDLGDSDRSERMFGASVVVPVS